jgi:hypothetical protein
VWASKIVAAEVHPKDVVVFSGYASARSLGATFRKDIKEADIKCSLARTLTPMLEAEGQGAVAASDIQVGWRGGLEYGTYYAYVTLSATAAQRLRARMTAPGRAADLSMQLEAGHVAHMVLLQPLSPAAAAAGANPAAADTPYLMRIKPSADSSLQGMAAIMHDMQGQPNGPAGLHWTGQIKSESSGLVIQAVTLSEDQPPQRANTPVPPWAQGDLRAGDFVALVWGGLPIVDAGAFRYTLSEEVSRKGLPMEHHPTLSIQTTRVQPSIQPRKLVQRQAGKAAWGKPAPKPPAAPAAGTAKGVGSLSAGKQPAKDGAAEQQQKQQQVAGHPPTTAAADAATAAKGDAAERQQQQQQHQMAGHPPTTADGGAAAASQNVPAEQQQQQQATGHPPTTTADDAGGQSPDAAGQSPAVGAGEGQGEGGQKEEATVLANLIGTTPFPTSQPLTLDPKNVSATGGGAREEVVRKAMILNLELWIGKVWEEHRVQRLGLQAGAADLAATVWNSIVQDVFGGDTAHAWRTARSWLLAGSTGDALLEREVRGMLQAAAWDTAKPPGVGYANRQCAWAERGKDIGMPLLCSPLDDQSIILAPPDGQTPLPGDAPTQQVLSYLLDNLVVVTLGAMRQGWLPGQTSLKPCTPDWTEAAERASRLVLQQMVVGPLGPPASAMRYWVRESIMTGWSVEMLVNRMHQAMVDTAETSQFGAAELQQPGEGHLPVTEAAGTAATSQDGSAAAAATKTPAPNNKGVYDMKSDAPFPLFDLGSGPTADAARYVHRNVRFAALTAIQHGKLVLDTTTKLNNSQHKAVAYRTATIVLERLCDLDYGMSDLEAMVAQGHMGPNMSQHRMWEWIDAHAVVALDRLEGEGWEGTGAAGQAQQVGQVEAPTPTNA